ncbi:MAG: cadherin domain-containing protein [Cyclobacteriaceae bacterium]
MDWGDNSFSQLFDPFQSINITQVATGFEHSIAIVNGSSVIAWGDNTYGQLNVPTNIISPVKVVAGLGHSVVLQADGTVKAWGFNEFGQSDVGTFANITDIAAGDEHTALLHADGTVSVVSGPNATYDLTPPPGLSDVRSIASGHFHILAIKTDSTVVSWGSDEFGETNVPTDLEDVIAVDGGLFHSMALKADGSLVGWGDNELFDQLEAPSGLGRFYDLSVGSFHNIALYGNGQIGGWGSNRFAETLIPLVLNGRRVSLITAGFAHNTAIATNNRPIEIVIPDTIFVEENTDINTLITILNTTDPDIVDDHIYSLVSGAGSQDNNFFSIFSSNDKTSFANDLLWGQVTTTDGILNNISFDYESDSLYYIRIRTTDLGGLSVEKPVVVKIIDENEPLLDLTLSENTINEREPVGTLIGKFSTQDTDLYDSHTYSFTSGSGDDDNGAFTIINDQLFSNRVFIHSQKSFYQIRVRSTDTGGSFIEAPFTIEVLPVNDAPDSIILSNNEIPDSSPIGSLVGFFTTIDEDPEDNHIYTFASGDGDTDNAAFTITSNSLLTNTALDSLVQSRYFIRVKSTDNGKPDSLSVEEKFVVIIRSSNLKPEIADQEFNVREDVEADYFVGTINAFDDGAIVYTITSGNEDGAFDLDTSNGRLTVADTSQLDALEKPFYDLKVTVTDAAGLAESATVRIKIIYVPAVPIVSDQRFEVREDDENGTSIGIFLATSPKDNTLTYEILSGNRNDEFSIDSGTGDIILVNSDGLDARAIPVYTLTIRVSDRKESLSAEGKATITVIDVNNAPTDILLDNNTIAEDRPAGTRIGVFDTVDEDLGDLHTYTFVDGNGSQDNDLFRINGDFLFSNQAFSLTSQNEFSIRVRSTDNGTPSLFTEKIFDIFISSLDLPVIPTAITPNGDNINDRWVITNIGLYPGNTVEVYDASGQPVFSSRGYRTPWDGTYNGEVLPAASYYYLIELNNSVNSTYSGTITILK